MQARDLENTSGRRESWGHRLARRLLAPPVAWLLRALAASWRIESLGDDPFAKPVRPPILAAIWHQDVIVAASVFRDSGAVVPVSRSRDGTHISAVMRHLGLGDPTRGSSSRGGTRALRGLVRAIRAGGAVAMMIDGPKGPPRVAKPGILAAARLSGEPVLPVALVARPRIRFRSWDRTQLPLPFARMVIGWGQLLPVAREASEQDEEAARLELETRLTRLRDAAWARLDELQARS